MVHVVPDMKIQYIGVTTYEDFTSFGSFLGGRGGCSVACSSSPQSSHIGCSSWLCNSEVGQKMEFRQMQVSMAEALLRSSITD